MFLLKLKFQRMDFGHVFNGVFFFGLLNIIFINIIFSGDNAVIIAMAVHSLPAKERHLGIIFDTLGAVLLRIGLTFVAAKLLEISFVKLAGGPPGYYYHPHGRPRHES
jgi:predicted tellurium resistance membrane protein TerC